MFSSVQHRTNGKPSAPQVNMAPLMDLVFGHSESPEKVELSRIRTGPGGQSRGAATRSDGPRLVFHRL